MGKHIQIQLSVEQRHELEALLHHGQIASRTNTRARILLLSDRSEGAHWTDQAVAAAVHCSISTVGNTRRRFCTGGLPQALYDKGWPGAPSKLTGELEAHLTRLACSAPPAGAARWSLHRLADHLVELGYVDSVSPSTVGAWLKKTLSNPGK